MPKPNTNNQLPATAPELRVALVHDWFVGGGAERVVYELHKLYPQAPIYTSYCSPQWQQRLSTARIITSYMQHWPLSKLRKFLPVLRALWFSRLDLSEYDLVISSSGAEAKGIKLGSRQVLVKSLKSKVKSGARQSDNYRLATDDYVKRPLHINYCHAPTHYYWSRYDQYMKRPGFGALDPLARLGLKLLVGPMRRWDYKAAQRPDYMIANSAFIKDEIKKYYDRDSAVIHPPVDIQRFETRNKKQETRNGFITAGRQTPYKRFDLAVAACTKLELPLTVIGNGPDNHRLRKMAGRTVVFQTDLTDDEVVRSFQTAKAFIFPGLDDFGIVAVEALAAGTPVIAYKAGGALDYIQPDKNGLFFDQPTTESLSGALETFAKHKFNSSNVAKSAQEFSIKAFQKNFKSFIAAVKK